MKYGISHSFKEETLEAKAKWFQQKPIEERLIEALESIDLVNALLQVEPQDDRTLFKTFRVLEQKNLIATKQAAGRPNDKDDIKILKQVKLKKRPT